jgi:hypothetical protein
VPAAADRVATAEGNGVSVSRDALARLEDRVARLEEWRNRAEG